MTITERIIDDLMQKAERDSRLSFARVADLLPSVESMTPQMIPGAVAALAIAAIRPHLQTLAKAMTQTSGEKFTDQHAAVFYCFITSGVEVSENGFYDLKPIIDEFFRKHGLGKGIA